MLSIAMMVKNEEKNIEESLKAICKLRGNLAIEIIVVDTGSTDKTVEIAKKYTDKVFFHKWEDDFAKMRNISLSYCSGKWVLVVDADEVLENPEEIVKLFKTKEIEKYNSIAVKIRNYDNSKKESNSIVNVYRLFKLDKYLRYVGIIHERPVCKEPSLKTDITFAHNGYINDDYELMKYKFDRNTKLLLKDIEENGDNIYTYYQLSQSFFSVDKIKEGIFYINKAINMIGDNYNLLKKNLYVFATYYKELYLIGDYDKCIEICKKVNKEDKNIIDVYYLLSSCYFKKNNYKEAIIYGELYLVKSNNNEEINITIEQSTLGKEEDIIEIIILSHLKMKNYKESYNLLIKNKEYIKNDTLLVAYYKTLVELEKIEELKEVFENNKSEDRYEYLIYAINDKILDLDMNLKNKLVHKFLGFDNKIDIYIKAILLNEESNIDESIINFTKFKKWKAEILNYLVNKKVDFINIFKELGSDDIKTYLAYMNRNHECIKLLLSYSQDKILTNDISELIILDHIEESLIKGNKIIGDEFKSLINRRLINKYNLMNKIYNKEILLSHLNKISLSNEEMFWYELRKILSDKEKDLSRFLSKLKEHVKDNNAYKNVYEVIQNEISTPLSKEMQIEKQRIIEVINELVNLGEIESAKETVKQLKDIVGNCSEIYNIQGVISYIEGDRYKALDKLLSGHIINSENQDIIYNINEIL